MKKKLLPIVVIHFQDHSASTDGAIGPVRFVAVGVVTEETREGYQIAHWLKDERPTAGQRIEDVTTYIAKVKGLRIETVGHLVMK